MKKLLFLFCAITHSAFAFQSHAVQMQSAQEVVNTINDLYNDTNNNCFEPDTGEPRGHYYCSGVLVRAVTDGDYLPWSHSPGAIRTGGSSYSWLRHDIKTDGTYRSAGFVLRNKIVGMNTNLPAVDEGFMCFFPRNGATGGKPNYGCGARGSSGELFPQPVARHRNSEFAWGQCEAFGIYSHQQWLEFEAEHHKEMCSWNIDRPAAWDNAKLANDEYAQAEAYYLYTELLLRIRDDGSMLKDKITAFFYDPHNSVDRSGLAQAKNFQIKLQAHGYEVPVLRVDFTAPASQRFSYRPEDQAIDLQ